LIQREDPAPSSRLWRATWSAHLNVGYYDHHMADDRCDLLCLDLEKAEALRLDRVDVRQAQLAASEAKAFADPTRLALAAALARGGELCVCDLSWIAEKPENLVSHHLRALRKARVVETRREHRVVFYSLNARGRELLAGLLGSQKRPATAPTVAA
jgi:DNA-binding transcriptional ArsR family regulator